MSNSRSWDRVKQLIKDEKELLDIMAELSDDQFSELMQSSEKYASALKEKYSAIRSEQEVKAKQAEIMRQQEEFKNRERLEQMRHQRKQQEMQQEAKQKIELQRRREEQERQLMQHKAELELQTTEEKTRRKLEAQRKFQELEVKRLAEEERLARVKHRLEEEAKEAEFQREKAMRLALEKERGLADKETQVALAKEKAAAELRKHHETKEYMLAKELKMKEMEEKTNLEEAKIKWEAFKDFFSGKEGRKRMLNTGALVCVSLGGFFMFRNVVAPFAYQAIRNRFFKPKLISRTVTYSPLTRSLRERGWWPPSRFGGPPPPTVVFPPQLQEKMDGIIRATSNTAKRGGFFGHMMLYGLPGTGKSLFAERLAAASHMDFAMMSGPSFAQFEPSEAIVEVKNLFKWANNKSHGLLLFVDEADTFLEDRGTMHPHRVAVLNEWINNTGTESRNFMCIYETNRPEVLDPAVQSRCTRSIQVPTPGEPEVARLLKLYLDLYLHKDAHTQRHWYNFWKMPQSLSAPVLEDHSVIERYAAKAAEHGFVGRDVSNLVIAWVQTAYANDEFSLDADDVERVFQEQIAKKIKEAQFLESKEERIDIYKRLI